MTFEQFKFKILPKLKLETNKCISLFYKFYMVSKRVWTEGQKWREGERKDKREEGKKKGGREYFM